jgi:ubiquinone/menaquinone biosynthesis C-methylase UbiE
MTDILAIKPLSYRRNIAFYCEKSSDDFKKDPYEQFFVQVLRQAYLHLVPKKGDFMDNAILKFVTTHFPAAQKVKVVEVGCSVGQLIGTLASENPSATCLGLDYSYQLLKIADAYWVEGKKIELPLASSGFGPATIERKALSNLTFGLADAHRLPLKDGHVDYIVQSFLFDRLKYPQKALEEVYRCLAPNGLFVLITPLNFMSPQEWGAYYPIEKLIGEVLNLGFRLLKKDTATVTELLDIGGNQIHWNCHLLLFGK